MPTVRIDPEFRDLCPPLSASEIEALEESIVEEGCRVPLDVWGADDTLIDGHNRHAICESLGIPFKTNRVELPDRAAALRWIVRNQDGRRNLNPARRAEMALRLKDALARIGVERKAHGSTAPGRNASVQLDESDRHDTRAEIAKTAKVGTGTVARYERVKNAAASGLIPEKVVEDVLEGTESINAGYKRVIAAEKEAKKAKIIADLAAQPLPKLDSGKFNVLVIDPPWRYDSRAKDATHRARNPYPDMAVEEIMALDVPDRLNDDAVVWLWTTNAFMRQAYDVAEAWGLRVRTILTWAKDRMGTGDWLRGQTEHCLLCTRGRPVTQLTNQTTILHGPLREHSRKPDEFYALVEALCPGTRLEMFARQPRDGWAVWGAETGKFDG